MSIRAALSSDDVAVAGNSSKSESPSESDDKDKTLCCNKSVFDKLLLFVLFDAFVLLLETLAALETSQGRGGAKVERRSSEGDGDSMNVESGRTSLLGIERPLRGGLRCVVAIVLRRLGTWESGIRYWGLCWDE